MTPEKLTEEHKLIGQTAAEFIDGEVLPVVERLEQKEWALNRELIKKCGALGLLGTNIPEDYGGVDLDKIATLIVSEQIVALRVVRRHLRRAGQPDHPADLHVRHRGAEAEVPAAASCPARWSAPTASANPGPAPTRSAPRRRAMQQADGSFVLSGEKMWITNGGFADVFIVFAKVDGEHFTAFIVERGVARRVERQGRAQAGPARLVDDAGDPAGREGAGRRGARRDRQGPQGRLQRAELRPLQAGRDVLGRRQASTSARRRSTRRRASSSACRSRRSAPSSTSSAR